MPSHSSSGGSGASIGGGGGHSGFSGSSSRGFSEGPGMRPRPPLFHSPWRFHFFGRPVVVTTNGQMGFAVEIFLLVFAMIAIFVSVGIFSSCKNNLKEVNSRITTLESQSAGYTKLVSEVGAVSDEVEFDSDLWKSKFPQERSLLTRAEREDGYLNSDDESNDPKKGVAVARYSSKVYTGYEYEKDEKLTGMFEYKSDYSKVSRYFIRYAFTVNGKVVFGETYAEFTPSMVSGEGSENFRTIKIAYSLVESGETPIDQGDASYARIYGYDSINLDFKGVGFELEEANLYLLPMAQSSLKSAKTTLLVIGIILGVIVVAIIITVVVTIIKCREEKVEALEEKQKSEAEAAELKKKKYCTFCGTIVPEDETKCPNCGASKFERK